MNSVILAKTLKIEGFVCYDHLSRWPQAHVALNEWIEKVIYLIKICIHVLFETMVAISLVAVKITSTIYIILYILAKLISNDIISGA